MTANQPASPRTWLPVVSPGYLLCHLAICCVTWLPVASPGYLLRHLAICCVTWYLLCHLATCCVTWPSLLVKPVMITSNTCSQQPTDSYRNCKCHDRRVKPTPPSLMRDKLCKTPVKQQRNINIRAFAVISCYTGNGFVSKKIYDSERGV